MDLDYTENFKQVLSWTLAISLWSLVAYGEALAVSNYLFYGRYFLPNVRKVV